MDRDTSKGGRTQGGQSAEQNENVREGFGDDMGTRVGRPDSGAPDDRSMARLSENADDRGIEGAVLAGSDNAAGSPGGTERGSRTGASSEGQRSSTRADGSSMEAGGATLDHSQRAQSGMKQGGGGEANRGVEGANVQGGTDEGSATASRSGDRSGSEPLEGRKSEHKPSYGGEGGSARTSSDQREGGLDYYGDEGTKKK